MTANMPGVAFLALAAAGIAAPSAGADESRLSNAYAGAVGATAVNLAAGNVIEQANVAAIALGQGTVAIASASVTQAIVGNSFTIGDNASASIDGAFNGANGLVAVNQAAGGGILQANIVAIALGIDGVAIAAVELAQVNGDAGLAGDNAGGNGGGGVTRISADSFANAAGVIQVNQAAGALHTTSNRFALTVSGGIVP